eukprot:CAMPEP_0206364608 /NCGR_PEP_ID=MMETSP0294-20121207/2323_1 /ASSEMBLY_ACC=CAM_ASM_000327 /TAXON_ID=39354 /ORGANISM="Heterosigma akashiwo, Strain CCMP2393" /LENGTH=307 /DNA_ID=CAMNT_0053810245 /DNA_START=111 /DNA_END=1034 /DNA_ORIENTATION=-
MRFFVLFFMTALLRTYFAQQQNNLEQCTVKEPWQPFVMVMSERTGSSWETALLNMHPNISMAGETFNPGTCSHLMCASEACDFLNNGRNHMYLPEPQSRDACFGNPDKEYALVKGTRRQLLADYHAYFSLFSSARPKLICSLRRNAVDVAISKYFQILLYTSCGGISLLEKKEHEQCWKNVMTNFAADPEAIAKLVEGKHKQGRLESRLCEMLSEKFPTFFLWYEDLLDDPLEGYRQLLSFLLGKKPFSFFQDAPLPAAHMTPVARPLDQMIVNTDEVIKAIEKSGHSFYLQTSRTIDYPQYLSSCR